MASTLSSSVTTKNFNTEVIQGSSATPVLVDFWAEWCGPCRMLAPILDEIAAEQSGKVKIVKLNVDEEKDLAHQYEISAIPTLLLFKNGEVVEKIIGMTSKKDLVGKIIAHAG